MNHYLRLLMRTTLNRETLSLKESGQIVLITISSLITAFKIRHLNHSGACSLPRINTEMTLGKGKVKKTVFFADALICLLLFWKPGKCFYRSYALAALLRRWGVPVKLNFGCENIYELNGRAKAHCWLTLNDLAFAEKDNPFLRFPIEIETRDNDIKYWFGKSPI